MTRLLFIRHGATKGNLEKRYVGSTDESLLAESREALLKTRAQWQAECLPGFSNGSADPPLVYVSPLRRCRETASILFPDTPQISVEDFRECDFGDFEYKNYEELKGLPDYQYFVDSFGESGFPHGETKASFSQRVCEAFLKLEIRSDAAFVVHGGTIMAILDRFCVPHRDFYDWQLRCGEWISARLLQSSADLKYRPLLKIPM